MTKTRRDSEIHGRLQLRQALLIGIAMLFIAGVAYRTQARRLKRYDSPTVLPIPLGNISMQIYEWQGEPLDLPAALRDNAGHDDYISRTYVNGTNKHWANLYVGFSGNPRTMLGHRPRVCYVANGWIHKRSKKTQFITRSGRKIDCLLHRFYSPSPDKPEIVVLNFYVLNGRLADDESYFSSMKWRTPLLARDPAKYVAQIQLSSVLENSVFQAASDITDQLLEYLPDQSGVARAGQLIRGKELAAGP